MSRRIFAAYRDEAAVQAHVEGRNVRASFLAVEPQAGAERLGLSFVESGADFQTMADSLALYAEAGRGGPGGTLLREPRSRPWRPRSPRRTAASAPMPPI